MKLCWGLKIYIAPEYIFSTYLVSDARYSSPLFHFNIIIIIIITIIISSTGIIIYQNQYSGIK